MKKTIFCSFMALCSLLIWMTPATAKNFEEKTTDDPKKVWNITFNSEILFNEKIDNYIYIESESGIHHPASLERSADARTIRVRPETPFLIGESYSLVITKDVQSATKKMLKEETRMSFKVQGKYIQSVQATLNPLVTNIVVQGTQEVSTMSISINGTNETPLHQGKNYQFSRGMPGLINGDEIHVRAYTGKGVLLEEQTYRISN